MAKVYVVNHGHVEHAPEDRSLHVYQNRESVTALILRLCDEWLSDYPAYYPHKVEPLKALRARYAKGEFGKINDELYELNDYILDIRHAEIE